MGRLRIEELESPGWLKQKYLEEGLTIKEMAELLGCSAGAMWQRLEKFNIPRRCAMGRLKIEELESSEWLKHIRKNI